MEITKKRHHRRKKTAAEIKAEIKALQAELDAKEQAERLKIGSEMQTWSGRETWEEIKTLLEPLKIAGQETS